MNIFGYSFVSKNFIQIYLDIRSCLFLDMNIFGYSFVSISIGMSHSGLNHIDSDHGACSSIPLPNLLRATKILFSWLPFSMRHKGNFCTDKRDTSSFFLSCLWAVIPGQHSSHLLFSLDGNAIVLHHLFRSTSYTKIGTRENRGCNLVMGGQLP